MAASMIAELARLVQGPGFRLDDGVETTRLVNALFLATPGVVAKAGGGQAAGTQLQVGYSQVDTCATNNDSVVLPPAVPGLSVTVLNNTAQTLAVFGVPVNPNNASIGDTIAASTSLTYQPTATGVTQATAKIAVYTCFKAGQWKQFLSN